MRITRPFRLAASASCVAALFALSACSENTETAATTAATTTTEVRVRTPAELVATVDADMPKGLHRCDYSGDIATYSKKTRDLGADNESLDETWSKFQAAGAVDSYIARYTVSTDACVARLEPMSGGHVHGVRKSFMSVIVRYPDAAQAEAGYKADLFGQSKLAQLPGATTGEITKLGPNSAVGVDEGGDTVAHQAVWQHGSYNLFLVSENFSNEEFTVAASAQRDRMLTATAPPT